MKKFRPGKDDPAATEITEDQIKRFWAKVDKSPGLGPNGDCWEWRGGQKGKEGYGGFYLWQIRNSMNCHRLCFLMSHLFRLGDIPKSIVIRHRCDNGRCVNPGHLTLGTHQDNSDDMVAAGNAAAGEKSGRAKMDSARVRELRHAYVNDNVSTQDLADRFDISLAAAYAIAVNRNWHDPDYDPSKRKHSQKTKFSQTAVDSIRAERAQGVSVADLVKKYGVSVSQVYNIIKGHQRKGGVM